jgi:hypothetical protein
VTGEPTAADDERLANLAGELSRVIAKAIDRGATLEDILAALAFAAGGTIALTGRRDVTHLLVLVADMTRAFHAQALARIATRREVASDLEERRT